MVVLGFGDVRLALILGALLGWYGLNYVLYGALLGHVLATSSASPCASANASFASASPSGRRCDGHTGRRTAPGLALGHPTPSNNWGSQREPRSLIGASSLVALKRSARRLRGHGAGAGRASDGVVQRRVVLKCRSSVVLPHVSPSSVRSAGR